MIFSEALIRVGVNVTPSIGSKNTARRGSAARRRAIDAGRVGRVLADPRQEGERLVGGPVAEPPPAAAKRSSSGPIFSSAFSPIAGIEAWPATPDGARS